MSSVAAAVSALRRVRPRVPFFKLGAHRVPTLGLYRNLLRNVPEFSKNIRPRIRHIFRANRHLTSPQQTIEELQRGYRWLEVFQRARAGHQKSIALLKRYNSFLAMKEEKEHWLRLIDKEIAWQRRLANRPILTGALIFPTPYSPPLPRMKRQPLAITRMISNRIAVQNKRWLRSVEQAENRSMARHERLIERDLLGEGTLKDSDPTGSHRVFDIPNFKSGWDDTPLEEFHRLLDVRNNSDNRAATPIPPALLEQIKQAKKEKIANKTREREKERSGLILPVTIRRALQGPPAHVLSRMTPRTTARG